MDRFEKREAFLSPLSGKDDYFHHFAESVVFLLITRREYLSCRLDLALWRKTVQGYSATREQLEMMVFLISGNYKGVVELLLRMLEKKEGR